MGSKSSFKNKGAKKSNNFNYPDAEDGTVKMFEHKHPIFCLKYQHATYNIENCTQDEKVSLLEQMNRLSQLTWNEIINTQRHGMGSEKISRASIIPKFPAFLTDDVKDLLAIRFQGKKPFLIHRDRFIAHLIFVDNKFEVYGH